MPFEPRIVAYLCTWCSYTGADTAGIARLKSPANLRDTRPLFWQGFSRAYPAHIRPGG